MKTINNKEEKTDNLNIKSNNEHDKSDYPEPYLTNQVEARKEKENES